VTKIDIGIVGGGYMGTVHAVAMNAVAAVFDTPLRPSRSSVGSWWDAYDWRGVMKIVHGSLRHREQSEATQTKGLQLRSVWVASLSLAMTVSPDFN
jgi:hypothetical protein